MTQATLSRFQMGLKILLANLGEERGRGWWRIQRAAVGQAGPPVPAPDPAPAAPQHHEVLDHLLAQVVVDAVDLVLAEQGGDVVGQPVGALQVLPKGLLHNDAVPASARAQSHVTPNNPSSGSGS